MENRENTQPARKSGRRDSNPRPTAWKAVTLPTELLPQRSTYHDLCLPDDHRQDSIGGGQGRIRTSEGARPTDLQSVAFDRFATCPTGLMQTQYLRRARTFLFSRAGDGTRTRNLLITNQLLYQLSYASRQNHTYPVPSRIRWRVISVPAMGYHRPRAAGLSGFES